MYPGGESGPRRKTPFIPVNNKNNHNDLLSTQAATNIEAEQHVVAQSTSLCSGNNRETRTMNQQQQQQQQQQQRQHAYSNRSNSQQQQQLPKKQQQRVFSKLFRRGNDDTDTLMMMMKHNNNNDDSQQETSAITEYYQMEGDAADDAAAPPGVSYHSTMDMTMHSTTDDTVVVSKQQQQQQQQQQSPIPIYNELGPEGRYNKEAPYTIFVGTSNEHHIVKKRWYGRMEDGYIAWSSLFFHNVFGFTIYKPLTAEEQDGLKHFYTNDDNNNNSNGKDQKVAAIPPPWMHKFTSLPNLAIPMSYFCIGVALQLLRTPLIVYFIQDLNATPAEVNVLFTVMAVPWCFKVLYGFLSDCMPISGMRRKPYFMMGWVIYIVSNLFLSLSPPSQPSIQLCILLVFTQTAGYMLADVMTDALIVERSRFETQENRGMMQSKGYIVRFFGSTVGATIGAVVYNKDDWDWYVPIRLVFFINATFPIVFLLPFVPYLLELETNCSPKSFLKQCRDLFETAQLRSVWQPMTFVYIYNALQLTNAAWMNFLVEGLDFYAWQIGLVSIVGSIMAWLGIMTYEHFFFASNWRIVYLWCTTLASIIALGQLILVFGLNKSVFGIPDIWFSMGDDVLVEFVIAVQFLPMCIMYLALCPAGSEGTTYAMLSTWSNLAGSLAFDISTALTNIWDVSSETIMAGDWSGVWKLSLLCGLIGPFPLVLLRLIPKDKEDQHRLQQDNTRHFWAGLTFILVMILTLIITFVESIYEVEHNASQHEKHHTPRRRLMRLIGGH